MYATPYHLLFNIKSNIDAETQELTHEDAYASVRRQLHYFPNDSEAGGDDVSSWLYRGQIFLEWAQYRQMLFSNGHDCTQLQATGFHLSLWSQSCDTMVHVFGRLSLSHYAS